MRSLCHLVNAEKLERFTKTNKLLVRYRTLQLSGAPDPRGHLDLVIFLLQNQTKILMLLSGLAATVKCSISEEPNLFLVFELRRVWFGQNLKYSRFGVEIFDPNEASL